MRQLGDSLRVLLLRVGKMSRERLLVLSLLVLVGELVLLRLLRVGPGFKLAVLLMLQFRGNLAVRLDVASVLVVSSILSGVRRRLYVRGRHGADGGMLKVL
jgi:hypothetical protein